MIATGKGGGTDHRGPEIVHAQVLGFRSYTTGDGGLTRDGAPCHRRPQRPCVCRQSTDLIPTATTQRW